MWVLDPSGLRQADFFVFTKVKKVIVTTIGENAGAIMPDHPPDVPSNANSPWLQIIGHLLPGILIGVLVSSYDSSGKSENKVSDTLRDLAVNVATLTVQLQEVRDASAARDAQCERELARIRSELQRLPR